jgi:hypothetical protein
MTTTTKTIYRCGECGSLVKRDGCCRRHRDASNDPEVVTMIEKYCPLCKGAHLVHRLPFPMFECPVKNETFTTLQSRMAARVR